MGDGARLRGRRKVARSATGGAARARRTRTLCGEHRGRRSAAEFSLTVHEPSRRRSRDLALGKASRAAPERAGGRRSRPVRTTGPVGMLAVWTGWPIPRRRKASRCARIGTFFLPPGFSSAIFVYGCIAWCLIAYRAAREVPPSSSSGNTAARNSLRRRAAADGLRALRRHVSRSRCPIDRVLAAPPNRIAATAFRWSWRFEYPAGRHDGGHADASADALSSRRANPPRSSCARLTSRTRFGCRRFSSSATRFPGMINVFDLTPNRTGQFLGALRAVLRARPRAHDVRGARGSAEQRTRAISRQTEPRRRDRVADDHRSQEDRHHVHRGDDGVFRRRRRAGGAHPHAARRAEQHAFSARTPTTRSSRCTERR